MSNSKFYSCEDLQESIFLGPDEIRTCCKRFFHEGELRGDVVLLKTSGFEQPTASLILEAKNKLIENINKGIKTDCSGCPWLRKDSWSKLDKLVVKHISFETHSVCNLKCTYCSDKYYGGKKPNYSVKGLIEELMESDALADCESVVWGGGEPLMDKAFVDLFQDVTKRINPQHNNIFSNAIIFDQKIAEQLAVGSCTMVTSIDAGTSETYNIVRGEKHFHTALKNLEKYAEFGVGNLTLKYILTDGNHSPEEVTSFCSEIDRRPILKGASFQISSDFKHDALALEEVRSILNMFQGLRLIGVRNVFIDDHVSPRINKYISSNLDLVMKELGEVIADPRALDRVIVWGAGQYARRALENSIFFRHAQVEFFVDSDPLKQGGDLDGVPIKSPLSIQENSYPIYIATSGFQTQILDDIGRMNVDLSRVIKKLVI